jgi:capsular exopolysaccharide synthesis family protein
MNPATSQKSSNPSIDAKAGPKPGKGIIARFWWIALITAVLGAVLLEPTSLGIGIGLAVGVVLLVLLTVRGDRISSPSAVLGLFSEPMLGQIPVVPESRSLPGIPLLQHNDPRVKYAEAFRSLRSSLLFMGYDGGSKSLLVSSPSGGEGASVVASNLAVIMAEAGSKTLLVDANVADGALGRAFQVDDRSGLANVLSGQSPWNAVLQQTANANLKVLTAGYPHPTSPPDAGAIGAIIEEAAESFDLIIVDAGPVTVKPLTSKLAKQVQGTLLVVRRNITSARRAKGALAILRQEQANVLGLVLNCIDPDSADFSYNQSTR